MSSNIKVQRICKHCNNEFTARTTTTLYCSHRCNSVAYKSKQRFVKIEASNKEVKAIKNQSLEILKTKEFLTVKDVAVLLNSSIRTIYRLIEQGDIKAFNITQRKTLIRRSDLDKLFKDEPNEIVSKSEFESKSQKIKTLVQFGELDISDCYNITEIQKKYGISESALNSLIKRNDIPKIKKGWFAYVPKIVIDQLLS